MYGLTLALRALWWRRGVSAAVLLVAALAVAAGAVAPLYVRSAGAQALADTLARADRERTGITLTADVSDDPAQAGHLGHTLPRQGLVGYPTRHAGLAIDADLHLAGRPAATAGRTTVMWRAGACQQVRIVAGRCPTRAGELLVGADAGRRLGWRLGDVLRLPRGDRAGAPLTVVGTYRPLDAAAGFWLGVSFHPTDPLVSAEVVSVEPALVAAATLDHTWFVGGVHALADRGRNVPALVTDRRRVCAHLLFAAGRCPAGETQVAVSQATAARMGWPVGTVLELPTHGVGRQVTVAGVYRPRDRGDTFWSEESYLGPSGRGDAIFATASALTEAHSTVTAALLLPLDRRGVTVDSLPALRNSVSSILTAAGADSSISTTTSIGSVLDSIDRNQRTLLTLVLLVAVQLVALAWFVLYLVVAAASDARGNEVALAKLHGLGWVRTAGVGVTEPLILLLLGAPLGLLLAVGVTARLTPDAAGTVGWPALAGAGVALAGGLVAIGLGARRTLTRPVLEQWRRSGDDRAGSRAFSAGDGVVVALALAGLYELHSGSGLRADQHDAVALLGPALLTVLVATLGVRLLPLACRLAIGRSRTSPRVGGFVAVRQVARRPAGLRLVTLLAVAVGLTVFAVYAVDVAGHNRLLRARAEVGADRVLTVAPGTADLQEAVRRLDPGGRAAMAVARVPDRSGTGRGSVLAVDSSRLATVAAWPSGAEPGSVARRLSAPATPPLLIRGPGVRLRVTPDVQAPAGAQPAVRIDLRDTAGNEVNVPLGTLRANVASYAGTLPGCAAGCRLAGITVTPGAVPSPTPLSTALLGLDQERPDHSWVSLPVAFSDAGRWTLSTNGAYPVDTSLDIFSGAAFLRYTTLPGLNPPLTVLYSENIAPLPSLPTRQALGPRPYPTTVANLDNVSVPTTRLGVVDVLPGVGKAGTLVDLASARSRVTIAGQAALATYQVWLSDRAPPDFGRRLSAAGIAVLHTETVADRAHTLAQQGPALALRLFVVAAFAAALLAGGAIAVTVYLGARRRAFELAALAAVGFGRGTLLRACLAEQGLLLGYGAALGALVGLIGSRLALPAIPLYADSSPIPTVLTPDLPLVAGVVLLLAALLASAAAAASMLLVRAAHPDRLREAAP